MMMHKLFNRETVHVMLFGVTETDSLGKTHTGPDRGGNSAPEYI